MLELNGHKYSREQFEGYKFRAIFELIVEKQSHTSRVDIYTTDESKHRLFMIVAERKNNNVLLVEMIYHTTKEQDDINSQIIEETLKDF